ncbi:pyruvate/2-oxoglutarate dehydrogenase complex dihydrolipoamide dehydrogenase (E3) component [Saccharopolyspora spinosa]|uniref:Pyruvate/2-oxoglutarate dehydrogenase complex dihydrolipoamide dehydrogenase (E3) component n=1 Tax=Saccharopolyspora spinosa TaxID=60894 RepID=A0A2N3Y479_SACSN|nr:NAD(P)/FAD-dependent oxidoreductase [Saccharopolyspora spinosa]PKW17739.1 pyruvate/2-oxoglutarate dehydrogenase complex dihydrolipoamide dehydrogenase (E3) component [Saccharopolyspora spinosa]
MVEEVDVVVIGMGPGGEDVAGRLASAGLDVVGVESRLVGGECPYFACIPTKMMVRAADAIGEARRVPELAGQATVQPDWTPVAKRIRDEATTNWNDEIAVQRFEDTGGRLVRGVGRVSAPGEVTVDGQVFRARRGIVLNPGTDPVVPPIDGLAESPYWTNRDAVPTTSAPESLLVLGGGPVGLEFTHVFARFGTAVTVLEMHPRLLSVAEPEASEVVTEALRADGVQVRTGCAVDRVKYDDQFQVHLDSGEVLTAERLLVATGRRTDLRALGVAAAGLDDQARSIPVDGRMRAADGVWAIGDITGRGAFTHTSVYQSRIAAADILGQGSEVADYRAMPSVIFTDPEVATVGLTESRARKQEIPVRTATTQISASTRGWIHKIDKEGIIKLVADAERGVLVGATVVAPAGGEIIGALAVAVHAEVPVQRLREMIFAYPTFHRAIEATLAELDA